MFDILNLLCISESTFYRYQRMYYAPVVLSFWKDHQAEIIKRYYMYYVYAYMYVYNIVVANCLVRLSNSKCTIDIPGYILYYPA